MSSCFRRPLHLPQGKNLHFFFVGSLCSLQPEDLSNREQALSTSKNSDIFEMLGFKSSQYAMRVYLSSVGGGGRRSELGGPRVGTEEIVIPESLLSRNLMRGSTPKLNQSMLPIPPCLRDPRTSRITLQKVLLTETIVIQFS